ncbi:MAG: tRNA pseudouridine(38-40) synthase TruA [Christensenellales bacterium]
MKNISIKIEYIGSNYCGFQRQKNGLTIQQVLEEAILSATGEDVSITPSGRTDAGVHALGQVANFIYNGNIPTSKLKIVINQHLPKDIRIVEALERENDFNARKSAKKKTYLYKIFTGQDLSVFDEDRVLHYPHQLDFALLDKCAQALVGEHDFACYVASGASNTTTKRTIYSASFERVGEYVFFRITGNGFLYNMVRILVGTMLEVATHKRTLQNFVQSLAGGKRSDVGRTAKACGLYLESVCYDT